MQSYRGVIIIVDKITHKILNILYKITHIVIFHFRLMILCYIRGAIKFSTSFPSPLLAAKDKPRFVFCRVYYREIYFGLFAQRRR